MKRSARRAFTLIELLVVMAILATLASLVFVALQGAHRSAIRLERDAWHAQRKLGKFGLRTAPLTMLFVGNSYTSSNDLPGMLAALVRTAGTQPGLEVASHTEGGATLKKHWDDGLALPKIKAQPWDFVVLQEQSLTPLVNRPQMHHYGKLFHEEIRPRPAVTLFYLTWAREAAPATQEGITDAYVSLARKLHAEVAPAGIAWDLCRKNSPAITLFDPDGSHPNPTGTYLTACAFYAATYMRSPEGLPATATWPGGSITVPPADALALQQHAWQAYREVRRQLDEAR